MSNEKNFESQINHSEVTSQEIKKTLKKSIIRHKKSLLTSNTNAKPFMCDNCGKSFKRRSDLKRHLKIHERNSLLKCDICDKKYLRTIAFDKHSREHALKNHQSIQIDDYDGLPQNSIESSNLNDEQNNERNILVKQEQYTQLDYNLLIELAEEIENSLTNQLNSNTLPSIDTLFE